MTPDLGLLHIRRLIVHEVPKRAASGDGDQIELTEAESHLDQGLRNYFRERITHSLGRAASEVVTDLESTSPVPTLITGCISSEPLDFIEASQQMARHLYACQTGVNTPGLVIVALATLTDQPVLAVLKLEREAGVRARRTEVGGKSTFDIEHIRELMLTQRTKVYKVGLFWKGDVGAEGLVCDEQRATRVGKEVADFFLKKFLGCKFKVEPSHITRDVYYTAQKFINEEVLNPQDKARYQIALLAEMNSGRPDFDPQRFAEDHLDVNDRMPLQNAFEEAGLPITSFPKDTSHIKPQLHRVEIDFESGIAVLGPPESFDKHVRMTELDEGRTRLQLEDRVNRVKGKR